MNPLEHSRISWASDIHLDHADEMGFQAFCEAVKAQKTSLLLLTGDIELGSGIVQAIQRIREAVQIPVFFILGNHDFYGSSFAAVRKGVKEAKLAYIHGTEGIHLNSETALVGHDGWADARAGSFFQSHYRLNDFAQIEDLKTADIFTKAMQSKLYALGDASRKYAERVLPELFKRYRKVIFITHVPPFREASTHEGKICSDEAAPFFVNQTLGEGLLKIMKKFKTKELLVLCGHTHSPACYKPLSNLTVLTAGAEYGSPKPQLPLLLQKRGAAL